MTHTRQVSFKIQVFIFLNCLYYYIILLTYAYIEVDFMCTSSGVPYYFTANINSYQEQGHIYTTMDKERTYQQ